MQMDKKISVLEKAIRHLKYLQERVKILEEQAKKAEIVAKNSQVVVDDDGSSSTELLQPVPSIKCRESDENVLLRIHCEKSKGILVKIIGEVEKLNLGVVNTNVVSFGSLFHDVTITAEKEKEFNLTVNEVVQTVSDVLQRAA